MLRRRLRATRRPRVFLNSLVRGGYSDVLVLGHINADPDALFSGLALGELLKKLGLFGRVDVGAPESVSEAARRILEKLGVEASYTVDPEPIYDAYVLVDTSDARQLGELYMHIESRDLFIVDHHTVHPDMVGVKRAYVAEDAGSTAELVWRLYKSCGLTPDKWVADILIAAIVFETRRFLFLGRWSLRAVESLLRSGSQYERIVNSLRVEMGRSEKIARLKAASRLRLYDLEGVLLAVTHVGAYEGSVARSLVELGADIAVVGSENDEVRVSSRRRWDVDVDLSKVMMAVADRVGGVGGGHPAAAGFKTRDISLDRVLEEIVSQLAEALGRKASILV